LFIKEVPNTGYPEYRIEPELYAVKIKEILRETKKMPRLVFITHVDYRYGNVNNLKKIGKIAHEYDIPFMVNAAYSAGIMPISMKDVGADFICCSGHKSMAASGLNRRYRDNI
jgi:Sep-tRNA:Cys-tRNA synthetase